MKKAGLRQMAIDNDASAQENKLSNPTKRSKGVHQLLQHQSSATTAPTCELIPAIGPNAETLSHGVSSIESSDGNSDSVARDRQRGDVLSVLHDVTQALTSCLTLEEILNRVAEAATCLLAAEAASIRLLDSGTGECRVEAANRLGEGLSRGTRTPPGQKPAGWIVNNLQSLNIRDMTVDKDFNIGELASREDVIGYLGVPLLLREKCIGVIEVYSRQRPRRFTRTDILRLSALGNQAAIAIENSRLFQSERDTVTKLQQLERHKSDFMAMVAHELRTPLTSIKGFAQLLQRQNACGNADGGERYLNIIEAEGNRMIGIINDILDISKMEAGLLQMSKQALSMPDLIHHVVDSAGYLSRGHLIELAVPESLPFIRGDATKIGQVLVNLISNAVKYSPESEPIQIGAAADTEGITVWVNDRGRGIPASKFDHIFNKYKIVDSNDCEAGKPRSSGLGLYISKNFVEAHGGKMWVESEEGKGAKFLFKLYY